MPKIVTLSDAASIGLHSIVLIAQSKTCINVQAIAKETKDSKHHVAKVMHILVKNGFITSVRGPKGGFRLNKKPEEVSLLDIYETIEGKLEQTHCPSGKELCPFTACLLQNITNKMTMEFRNYLKEKTLDKII